MGRIGIGWIGIILLSVVSFLLWFIIRVYNYFVGSVRFNSIRLEPSPQQ